jgi:hypothetical protein
MSARWDRLWKLMHTPSHRNEKQCCSKQVLMLLTLLAMLLLSAVAWPAHAWPWCA